MSNPNGNGGWKKGKSGNPKGRPTRAHEDEYLRIFNSVITPENFKKICNTLYSFASGGNMQAIKMVLEYKMGQPTQKHEVAGKDGGDIYVTVVKGKND